jgi:hypothetical protein
MFVGKATSMPYSGAPERCFTWVSSSLTHKHYTSLERPVTPLSVTVNYVLTKCRYAECHHIGWVLSYCVSLLSDLTLTVIILFAVFLNVPMQSGIMLSIVLLNVIRVIDKMLSVIMLCNYVDCYNSDCCYADRHYDEWYCAEWLY